MSRLAWQTAFVTALRSEESLMRERERRRKENSQKRGYGRRQDFAPITLEWLFDRSIPEPNSGCFLWLAATSEKNGYAAVNIGRKTRRAHRVAYELANRETVPKGIDVCHKCDVRSCINPDHLFLGTRLDNMRDCVNKGRFKPLEPLSGEASPNSKLTDQDVIAIRADTRSQRAIARAYGVDKGTIAAIIQRRTWRHL